jgi:hypothetical protein
MQLTETFYHGICNLFDKLSLSFIGSGEGKSKFGQGIYITSSYKTAALYAAKAAKANGKKCYYVYTVEVPVLTENNHIFSCKPVNQEVINRVEKEIGQTIPEEVKSAGKLFRKYLGNLLTGQLGTIKKMMGKADSVAEKTVSQFLNSVDIVYLAWPQSQTKPEGDTNRALLNEEDIRIIKIEQVEVDEKNKLIEKSVKLVQP